MIVFICDVGHSRVLRRVVGKILLLRGQSQKGNVFDSAKIYLRTVYHLVIKGTYFISLVCYRCFIVCSFISSSIICFVGRRPLISLSLIAIWNRRRSWSRGSRRICSFISVRVRQDQVRVISGVVNWWGLGWFL